MILCIAKTEGLLTAGSYWFCEPVLLLHSLLKCCLILWVFANFSSKKSFYQTIDTEWV